MSHGPEDYRPKMHDLLVSAIDKAMATCGFTKTRSESGLDLEYFTVASTSIDLKELEKAEREGNKSKAGPYYVGKLPSCCARPGRTSGCGRRKPRKSLRS